MSDLFHLADSYRARARWPDADRIAWIRKDRWLGFPKAEAVRKTLDAMLRYPPRTRMPCLLIYGQTGMGKARPIAERKTERLRGWPEVAYYECLGRSERPDIKMQPAKRLTHLVERQSPVP